MAGDVVVVTGGAGFIGSNVVTTLAEDGTEVVVCDRFAHDDSWRYIAPVLIHDIIEPEALLAWLRSHSDRVAAIVHMGGTSATTETDVLKMVGNNIRFTLDLWTYAAEHDTPFIYASSAATYGDGSSGFVDDDTSSGLAHLRPLNLYGWTKHFVDRRIAEDVLRGRPTPSRWAGLKFFNVYGPNETHKGSMRSVVHQLYPAAARGERVRLFKSDVEEYPDGGQLRDFVYVKDCCAIVRNVLHVNGVAGIFNAGTGTARTFEDLAKAVFKAVGETPRIDYVEMPPELRGKYQYFTEADTTKLTEAGLAPDFHTLEAGIGDYVHSHLVHEFHTKEAGPEC